MRELHVLRLSVLAASLALGFAGCGGHQTAVSAIGPTTTPTTYPYPTYPSGTGSSGSSGSSGSVDPSWDNAIQMSFTLNGTNSGNETFTSAPISTDNLLKVRLTALPGGPNSVPGQNTNFTANYYCAGFTVSALGMQVDSQPLAVNGGVSGMCQNGSAQIIDFSRRLSPGHGDVVITVTKPRYDWYCMLYTYYPWLMGGTATMYCPLHPVYQYHTVMGSLQVQTNGTSDL